jgi:hypothetical protein
MSRPQWQRCACKDCNELALIPKGGGKSFCEECSYCEDAPECLHKDLAYQADVYPDDQVMN